MKDTVDFDGRTIIDIGETKHDFPFLQTIETVVTLTM